MAGRAKAPMDDALTLPAAFRGHCRLRPRGKEACRLPDGRRHAHPAGWRAVTGSPMSDPVWLATPARNPSQSVRLLPGRPEATPTACPYVVLCIAMFR